MNTVYSLAMVKAKKKTASLDVRIMITDSRSVNSGRGIEEQSIA